MVPADNTQIALLQRELADLRLEMEVRSKTADVVFDVSMAVAASGSLPVILTACCETLVRKLGAAFARVWTLRPEGGVLELQASAGLYTHIDGAHSRIPVGQFKIGRIAQLRLPHLTNDVPNDIEVSDRAWAKREGMVAFAGHPLLIGDKLLGVLAIFARSPFNADTLQVLETSAGLIAHGIDREWLRERTEAALRASERSNEALQRFATIASHDLQEPLRQITAFSQMLSELHRAKLDSDAQQYLDYIVDGAARMGRLIQGLLAYAQIEALDSTPVGQADSEAALDDALHFLSLSVNESRALITHDRLPVLNGNQTQITQLFQNLVSNALKYRSKSTPKVHVSAIQEGSEWIFSVSDNGVGIPPEYRTKIFGVFTRLHGSEISGAGLGLAFCSKIVELHRGRIWVEENAAAETGSIFRFAVPA
jgi:signal transduction histidine kinase